MSRYRSRFRCHFALLGVVGAGLAAAGTPAISWTRPINGAPGPSNDDGYLLAVDSAGNAYMAGNTQSGNETTRDVLLARINADGTLAWTHTLAGTGNNLDEACGIGVDAAGDVYVGGYRFDSATHMDWFLQRLSPAGSVIWTRTYGDNAGQSDDRAVAMDLRPDGSSAMVGTVAVGGLFPTVPTLVRYDADGTLLWSVTMAGTARAVKIAGDGAVYVAGSIVQTAPFNTDLWVAKYSAAGALEWTYTLAGVFGPLFEEHLSRLALAPDDDVIVVGTIFSGTTRRYNAITIRLSPGGSERWRNEYHLSLDELAVGVTLDPVGGNIYTMASTGFNASATIAYSSTGTQLWARSLNGDPTISTVDGTLLAVAPNGALWWSVARGSGASRVIAIEQVNPVNGLIVQSLTHNTAGLDFPADMRFASNGDLYLVGTEDFQLVNPPPSNAVVIRVDVPSDLLPGDTNCDGVVSVGDIAGFVLALTDPAGYATTYPGCELLSADANGDGAVSVTDIGPFVTLLAGG